MLGFYRTPIATRSCPRSELVTGDPSARLAQFDSLARVGASHVEVRAAAARCWRASLLARVDAVAALVQSLPYLDDPPGTADLVRPPCETLRVGGDCDCRCVLAAALLELLGVRWRLVWVEQPRAEQDHVVVQVFVALRWQWLEVTVPGARMGESPGDAVARLGYGRRVTGGAHGVGD